MRKTLPLAFLASAALGLGAVSTVQHEDVELAPFMSQLQIYSQKLGYSIEAKNTPLARPLRMAGPI